MAKVSGPTDLSNPAKMAEEVERKIKELLETSEDQARRASLIDELLARCGRSDLVTNATFVVMLDKLLQAQMIGGARGAFRVFQGLLGAAGLEIVQRKPPSAKLKN